MGRPSSWLAVSVLLAGACGGTVPNETDAAPEVDAPGVIDATPETADAAIDANPLDPDAAPPPPRCDVTKPFGAPTRVPRLNHATQATVDGAAKLTPDELTVVFHSNRPTQDTDGDANLWIATRRDRDDLFSEPMEVEGRVNTATGGEFQPFLAADRKSLFYSFTPPGGTSGDVYLATRDNTTVAFGTGAKVIGLGTDQGVATDDANPHLLGDTLYYSSSRQATDHDIFRATRDNTGAFGSVEDLEELNTAAKDAAPVLSDDGRDIYWGSTRTDGGAKGNYDIWHAHRDNPTGVFTGLQNLNALNTAGVDLPSWISPDGCVLYLESGGDIMIAVRPR